MDLEARNLQPSVRAGQLAKLREYKSDLNNLKGTLKRITAGNGQQGAREELLESGMADTLVVCSLFLIHEWFLIWRGVKYRDALSVFYYPHFTDC